MREYQHVDTIAGAKKEVAGSSYSRKAHKDNFWISNRAIISVMKKEHAIMFGLFFAF